MGLNQLEGRLMQEFPKDLFLVPCYFLFIEMTYWMIFLSKMRLFADNSSLSTVVNGIEDTRGKIEKDLCSIYIYGHTSGK